MRNVGNEVQIQRKALFETDQDNDRRHALSMRGIFADTDSANDDAPEPVPDDGREQEPTAKDADEDSPTLDVGDPSGRFKSDGKADRAFDPAVEKSASSDGEFVGHDAEVPDPDEEEVEKSHDGLTRLDSRGSFATHEELLLRDIRGELRAGTDVETAIKQTVAEVEEGGDGDADIDADVPVVVSILKEAGEVLETVENLEDADDEEWVAVKDRLDALTDRAADAPAPQTSGEEALWDAVSERAATIQAEVAEGA